MGCSTFSSAATIRKTSICGISTPRASCPTASSTRPTADANICSATSGTARFEEVSAQVGIDSRRWALAAAAADLRGTGRPDLFIANDYGISELYFNDGQRFREVGKQTGVGFAPKSGMNVAFGDILNQGRYAVYVSNISEDGILIQGNNLWVPKEGTRGRSSPTKTSRVRSVWSSAAGASERSSATSTMTATLDLYLTNGYVSADRDRSYWYDFSKVAGGNSSIIGDARNWPAFDGRSLAGYQSKCVWMNDGAGKFVDVAQAVGVTDTHDGRSVAVADLWNRGVLDVVVANQNGPLLVYRNTRYADERLDRIRAARNRKQPQRDRRRGHAILERPAAGAGRFRRQRLRCPEPAPTALWTRQERRRRKGSDPLAFGCDCRRSTSRPRVDCTGSRRPR